MSDVIRIKRSDATSAPTSLAAGELAYSEVSGYLYYGRISDGAPVIIGGKALKDKLDNLTSADISNFTAAVEAIIANASIGDLADVDITGASVGQILTWNGSAFELQAPGTGVTTFVALNDTPSSFTGSEGYIVKVNAAGNALEFQQGVNGGTF